MFSAEVFKRYDFRFDFLMHSISIFEVLSRTLVPLDNWEKYPTSEFRSSFSSFDFLTSTGMINLGAADNRGIPVTIFYCGGGLSRLGGKHIFFEPLSIDSLGLLQRFVKFSYKRF